MWAGRGYNRQRGREGERRKEERKARGRTGKKGKLLQLYLMPEFSELSLPSSVVKIYKMTIKYETHLKHNCQLSWQCVCLYMELALHETYLGYWASLVFNLECPKWASTFFFFFFENDQVHISITDSLWLTKQWIWKAYVSVYAYTQKNNCR